MGCDGPIDRHKHTNPVSLALPSRGLAFRRRRQAAAPDERTPRRNDSCCGGVNPSPPLHAHGTTIKSSAGQWNRFGGLGVGRCSMEIVCGWPGGFGRSFVARPHTDDDGEAKGAVVSLRTSCGCGGRGGEATTPLFRLNAAHASEAAVVSAVWVWGDGRCWWLFWGRAARAPTHAILGFD